MKITARSRSRGGRLWRLPLSRVLVAMAMGCFYVTLSGHSNMVEEEPLEIESLITLSSTPPSITFPGYPLTREGMLQVGASMGRSSALQQRNSLSWCRPRPQSSTSFLTPNLNTTQEGLFFVKTPKTASQSINRILKRLVTRVGHNHQGSPCFLRGHHIKADPAKWYSHRNTERSVLLTSLRDPATRALSRIYWTLSTRQFKGAVEKGMLQRSLQWTDVETGSISEGQGGFQLNYVSFATIDKNSAWRKEEPEVVQNPEQIHAHVQQLMRDYDFVLVQERLEESLVALQLLLGLETADVLSMPLHVGGSYLYDRHAGCLELHSPPHLSSPSGATKTTSMEVVQFLDDYFQSPTWYAQNYGDYVLQGAATASLDATIIDLGAAFPPALQEFRRMQQLVLEECSKAVIFPCSVNGTIQRDDYQLGNPKGAGDRYPQKDIEACIDQVVKEQY